MRNLLTIDMPDNSVWAVPVSVIARHRATYYAEREYGGDIEESLADDTLPLFESDPLEIIDWAANNMDWADVQHEASMILSPPSPDLQEGWRDGEMGLIDDVTQFQLEALNSRRKS